MKIEDVLIVRKRGLAKGSGVNRLRLHGLNRLQVLDRLPALASFQPQLHMYKPSAVRCISYFEVWLSADEVAKLLKAVVPRVK